MINFILFHKGCNFPNHIRDCIKQIQHTQTNYKIYLLTDSKIVSNNDVTIIDLNTLHINLLDNIDYYRNDNDPLWRSSFERFFYINEFIIKNKLNDIIHFDNDVLLYHNTSNIINILKTNVKCIGLTKHKENEYVCGFMYINNHYSLKRICKLLLELAKLSTTELENKLGSMPHEMRLLGHISTLCDDITHLPGTPRDENYSEFNYIFDPSSYGQYFGGSGDAPKLTVHRSNVNRLIDKYIINQTITPFIDIQNKKPYIKYNNTIVTIFNLHIHSKQLVDFKTYS